MNIRQETAADYSYVYNVVKTAFATAEQSDGNEQNLVAALRESRSFIPELSLVATVRGEIAGHIYQGTDRRTYGIGPCTAVRFTGVPKTRRGYGVDDRGASYRQRAGVSLFGCSWTFTVLP